MRSITLLLAVAACDSETAIDTSVVDTDNTFTTPVNPDSDDDGYIAITSGGNDCNDEDYFINPDATEHCDGLDENCNGDIDEFAIDGQVFYQDLDGDGFGDPTTGGVKACAAEPGLVTNTGDCDDADPARNPGAQEICNDGFDDDCTPSTFETAMIGTDGFSSLDDAIAASIDGGEIQLCPGLVFAKNVTVDKAVTIVSWDGTRTASIIDGGVAGAGAMFIVDGGALTLQSVTVQNAIDGVATALTAGGGTITADDVLFSRNDANGNGGALAGTTMTISGSDFQNNTAGTGGAIYATAPGLLTITDSTFLLNESTLDGGAIYTSATAVLVGVELTDNEATDGSGGALAAAGNAVITLNDTTFTGNNAQGSGGGFYGSGVSVTADETTVFDSNTAEDVGVDLGTNGGGGAFLLANGKDVTWSGGLFIGNRATNASFAAGGGLFLSTFNNGGSIDAGDVTADGNTAYTGAGIYMYGGPITLHDTLTQNNTAVGSGGGYGGGTSINLSSGKLVTIERVEYRANVGGQASATDIYDAIAIFKDCILEENVANYQFGGEGTLYVDANASITVEVSNMGVDVLDNSPTDVYVASSGATYNYGDPASFTCDYNSGSCK